MPKKTAGKLNQPPAQDEFNEIPLGALCREQSGTYYRLHSINRLTGHAWSPLHFSSRGNTRFDPKSGTGTLYLAETLAGAMMELFDDHWGPVGSFGRSITEQELRERWVCFVSLSKVHCFDATGANLSKIGTDAQLLTGQYSTTRKWASRMMHHPDQIDGILYRSRHDPSLLNIALFQRTRFLPPVFDTSLSQANARNWTRIPSQGSLLVHGPEMLLKDHASLNQTLIDLQVARLP